ncbi:MAG TPA: PspC domain-containing protein [Steroidobacteraceae bacterium]|jgi:phage shock protein C|nr:PspC domain-containing protein [Steroidobacteraceae bacterium]
MSVAEELERLQSLRDRGAISDEEFTRAKAQVLDQPASARSGSYRSFLQQLARSRSDRVFGGVCGGLGHSTDLPSWAWRVIFCLTLLYFGAGLLIYILLWIFLPQEP